MAAQTSPTLLLSLGTAPTLNFAMEQSGVPIVTGARLTNGAPTPLENAELTLSLRPGIADESVRPIPASAPAKPSISASSTPGSSPAASSPSARPNARRAAGVRHAGTLIASGQRPIDVLAYNEWAGPCAPPALVATFVAPNAPSVAGILARVRDRLHAFNGNAGLTGYQEK